MPVIGIRRCGHVAILRFFKKMAKKKGRNCRYLSSHDLNFINFLLIFQGTLFSYFHPQFCHFIKWCYILEGVFDFQAILYSCNAEKSISIPDDNDSLRVIILISIVLPGYKKTQLLLNLRSIIGAAYLVKMNASNF